MSASMLPLLILMGRNAPASNGIDKGTLPEGEKFTGIIIAKRSPAQRGLPRRTVAAIARAIRVIFNYAPVSTAPYQLRLYNVKRTAYCWAEVTAEQYASATLSEEFTARGTGR